MDRLIEGVAVDIGDLIFAERVVTAKPQRGLGDTLDDYLCNRQPPGAITRLEAKVVGVKYPLVSGWRKRHGGMVLSEVMITGLMEAQAKRKATLKRRKDRHEAKASIPIHFRAGID